MTGEWRDFALDDGRRHHGGLIVSFTGVDQRDAAAALLGADIAVQRAQLRPAQRGEYYWADLLGLQVVNRDGVVLGRVSGLLETPAHDVVQVTGERERLIPFVRDIYILDVDLEGELMRVDWHVDD